VNPEKPKKKSVKQSFILSILISAAIILFILYFTINDQTINYLQNVHIKYEFFLAAVVIHFLFWVIWGLRIKILSNAIEPNFNITLIESTKIVIANLFLANITPSMAGGEPVRIYLLNKNGLNVGGATAITLGERLLDALFFLICVPFAFFLFGQYITNDYLKIGLYFAVLLFIIFVIVFIYAIRNPQKIKSFLFRITSFFGRLRKKEKPSPLLLKKISTEVDNFHQSMTFFITKGKKTLVYAGIITAIFWITSWMIPICLLIGLGIEPFILESCAAQILLVLIAMMPTTPGSTGISEGGTAALYGVFLNSSILGVFVLLFRFITYHMGLIAGAIFQYKIFKSVTSFSTDMISTEKTGSK
jgi:uncharacterized protein (TIRG00374 family)